MKKDTYAKAMLLSCAWARGMTFMQSKPENFGTCPFVTAQWLLQGKWSIVILHHLSGGTLRFGELERRMPELTHSTLSSQLKRLEAEGLVRREVFPEVPPRVEYSLTQVGEDFAPVLASIETWGRGYAERLKNGDVMA